MKNKQLYIKIKVLLILALFNFSCDEDSAVDSTLSGLEGGAVLTTVNVTGQSFNLFNPENSELSVQLRFNDHNNNDTMDNVQLFVSFVDTTPNDMGETISVDEANIGKLTLEDFDSLSDGFPSNIFTIGGKTILDALSLTQNQLDGGDLFFLRYQLNLIDGRSFTSNNVGVNVSSTSHDAPFRYQMEVFCPIEDTSYMTGDYMLEQVSGTNPFFGSFGASFGNQMVTITSPDNGTARTFNFAYFPDSFRSDYRMDLNLVCGLITMQTNSNSGTLGCGDGTIQGVNNPDTPSMFDLSDDSQFTLNLRDFDNDAGCDTGSVDMVLRLVKL